MCKSAYAFVKLKNSFPGVMVCPDRKSGLFPAWLRSRTEHTRAKQSRCVLPYLFWVSFIDLGQYTIGLVVPSSCCYRSTNPIWTAHALVSSVMCSVAFGKASTGGDVKEFFSAFTD